MQTTEQIPGIFWKVTGSRKRNIVIAENLHGSESLYITISKLEEIYRISYKISELQFQSKYREVLKISTTEIDKIKNHLENKLGYVVKGDAKEIVEKLIAENLQTADSIIGEHGTDIDVIVHHKLLSVKAVLLFYPDYLLVQGNYLLIRGGSKLLEEVIQRTKAQFEGVVPGRWKWNLGNWVNKQSSKSSEQIQEPPVIAESPPSVALVNLESEMTAIQQTEISPKNEGSLVDEYEDYFN